MLLYGTDVSEIYPCEKGNAMKKFILGLALLIAVSAAAFANTPADEGVSIRWKDIYEIMPLKNADGTGFDIYTTDPSKQHDYMFYLNSSVQGWLFDMNEDTVYMVFKDFDSIRDNVNPPAAEEGEKMLQFQISANDPNTVQLVAMYRQPWKGSGVYAFGPEQLLGVQGYDYRTKEDFLVDIYNEPISVRTMALNITDANQVPALIDVTGNPASVRFLNLPEPSTYAYGIMGLASLLGLRRRIRK